MDGWKRAAAAMALTVAVAACGGETPGGDGDGPAGSPTAAPADSAAVKSGDERVLRPLVAGRYRLSWTATDCDTVKLSVTTADGTVIYEKTNPIVKVVLVQNVPDGQFYIEQTEPSCTEWTMSMDKI